MDCACDLPFGTDRREVVCEAIGIECIFDVPVLTDRVVPARLQAFEGAMEDDGPLSARDLDFPLTDGDDGERRGGPGTAIVINVSTRRDLTTLSKVR